ncbi:MAG: SusD/RagB family nutrient-binding outer membrane lipoprotein [Cyclobacteriaceae bacterium]
MKNISIKVLSLLLAMVLISSCKNYDELVKNPNLPTAVPPNLLLHGVLNTMNNDPWSDAHIFNQFFNSTYTYYGTNNYDQDPFFNTTSGFYYRTLENVVRMEQEAKNSGAADVNPYSALGKFFRAYFYNEMTQKYGDIPVTEALQGQDNIRPKYDSQKAVMMEILRLLDEANTDLASLITAGNTTLAGDIYLGNDLRAWRKVVNTFTLRVLVSLSKKDTDTDLNVKSKFAAILGNATQYPILTGNGDNLKYVYNAQFNNYPKTPGTIGFDIHRQNVGATFLNLTTALKDPRTFISSTPAPAQLTAGKTVDDFAAYVGASNGDDMGTLGANAQGGVYSYVNPRYYFDYAGSKAEPSLIIGYPELCFNVAEGINRGWAAGSAATWYTNGINASMEFFGLADGVTLTITDKSYTVLGSVTVDVTTYLAQPSVAYAGDNAAGLQQILEQKYIAFWQNSGWQAFYNYRRTGVPTFLTGSGTGNAGKIPTRWQYPIGEAAANPVNYKAAVQEQFNGTDDLNGKLWINQ